MRVFHRMAAGVIVMAAVGAVALGTTACSHDVSAQDAADTATDVGSAAASAYMDGVDALIDFGTDLGKAVKEGDLSKIRSIGATRVVATDASTGEELKTVTDSDAIKAAFAGFGQKWQLSDGTDGLTPEYKLQIWANETIKLGDAKDRTAEAQVCTFTTYQGSNVVTVALGKGEALKGALSVDLTAPDAASVDALRALAR